jgi:hypothetical protein
MAGQVCLALSSTQMPFVSCFVNCSTPSCQSWGDEQLVALMRNPPLPPPPAIPTARPSSVRSPLRRRSLEETRPPGTGGAAGWASPGTHPLLPLALLDARASGRGGDAGSMRPDGQAVLAGMEPGDAADAPPSPPRRGGLKRHTSAADKVDRCPSPAPGSSSAPWSPVLGGGSGGGAGGRSMSLGRVSFATERSGAGLDLGDGSLSGAGSQAGYQGARGMDAATGSHQVCVSLTRCPGLWLCMPGSLMDDDLEVPCPEHSWCCNGRWCRVCWGPWRPQLMMHPACPGGVMMSRAHMMPQSQALMGPRISARSQGNRRRSSAGEQSPSKGVREAQGTP